MRRPVEGLVVVVGASLWGGIPLTEQHLASELAASTPVLYVNPPTSFLSRFRSREAADFGTGPGLREVSATLSVLSVRLPPLKDHPRMKRWTLPLFERRIRRAVRELGHERVRATIVASMDPVLGALDEGTSIYLANDDYVAGSELVGLPPAFVEANVRRLCESADRIVAVTPALADRLSEWGGPTAVLPQGVDVQAFATSLPPKGRRRAGFVGHLSERIDADLLVAVARKGVPITMIGPPQETMSTTHLDALRSMPDVTWTGRVPHADLHKPLADVTTCLVPYRDTTFNRASFPMKLLEYLAAGRRVVSVPLPALDQLDPTLIDVADGPQAFADAVERSLSTPLTEAEARRRRDYARNHSWQARALALLDIIREVEATASGGIDHGAPRPNQQRAHDDGVSHRAGGPDSERDEER